ncbi:MAG: PTS system mannose/fructose/sorbose family transporter subunit IID [Lachnospiraceae bacterium]|nr:PTS system mannose/fructose/sorbose family transporter subunit IID [Lachnospiraceae bacterium]
MAENTTVQTNKKGKRVVTKEDRKVMFNLFWRSNLIMGSPNQVVMSGHGVLFTVAPYLEEFYKDDPEERSAAFDRHSTYYNTNPYTGAIVWVLIYLLERQRSLDKNSVSAEAIQNTKIALMGPLAAIGDTLFQGSIGNILAAMVMGMAQQGNFLSIVIYLGLFLALFAGLKWVFTYYTYVQGEEFIISLLQSDAFDRIQDVISIIGLMMMGCLTATVISFSFNWTINVGGTATDFQSSFLDALMPGIMPLAILFTCFALLNKKFKPTTLIYGILVICIVLSYLGLV